MVRKVRKADSEQWHRSEIDPDIEYLIKPPGNRISSHSATLNSELTDKVGGIPDFWGGDYTYDMVGFSLKDIKGLFNEDDTPFKLDFKNKKVGRNTEEKRVTDAALSQLPADIFHEIEKFVIKTTKLSKKEKENMDFSSDSHSQETPLNVKVVTETSPNVDGSIEENSGQ